MTGERERSTWTDDRLDDFRVDVDRRFDWVDQRFDQVDQRFDQVDQRFVQVDKRFDHVDQRLERIDGRIDELHRTLFAVGGGMAASILIGAAGIAATQI